MSKDSAIGWTNSTWNPWRGCHKVSTGCQNCYMYREQKRYGGDPNTVVRAAEKTFNAPLKWKEPAKVFTCSWSDWFIEEADEWRDEAWDIIKATPHLTYQILTKRVENIRDRLPAGWPWDNVWLGVTAENQEQANKRIPDFIKIPAKLKFLSIEPMLGPVSLGCTCWLSLNTEPNNGCEKCGLPRWLGFGIGWVIVGGESDKDPRPMDEAWATHLMGQCVETAVPFYFKQVGGNTRIDGIWGGDKLNGKEYHELPEVR